MRKTRANKKGKCVLFVRYNHADQACYFSTGEKIEPQYWDSESEVVRKSYRGYTSLNNYLQLRKLEIDEIRLNLLTSKQEPTINRVRAEYQKQFEVQPQAESSFLLDHWDNFIYHWRNIKLRSEGTMAQYASTLLSLKGYETFANTRLTFDSINEDFIEQFTFYLFSENISSSTVGSKTKNLKVYMSWAVSKGLTTNLKFKNFKKLTNRTDIVTLDQHHLDTLFLLNLSYNKRLERVRDLFIIGCATGLRFSDLSKLKKINIKDGMIRVATKKTDTFVRIPINEYSQTIIDRYPDELPTISNSNMNKYLKEIAKLAKFNELCEVSSYKGGVRRTTTKQLHELITTHTMRRVFATQSLQRGMQPQDVMKITGHTSLKTFQLYINVSEKRLNSEVAKAWNTAPKSAIEPEDQNALNY